MQDTSISVKDTDLRLDDLWFEDKDNNGQYLIRQFNMKSMSCVHNCLCTRPLKFLFHLFVQIASVSSIWRTVPRETAYSICC